MALSRILVTGGAGFIGSRLISHLHHHGQTVKAAQFDVLDPNAIDTELKAAKWDAIIHLAAISNIPACEKDPELARKTNFGGTQLLLKGITRHCPAARFLFASTAQVYQAPTPQESIEGVVFSENRKILPQNIYAQTKRDAELLIEREALSGRIRGTVLRLFNHSHRSQSPDFFLPHIYASIKKTLPSTSLDVPAIIPVGNLDVSRDIGSVTDLLSAFDAVLAREPSLKSLDVFNICSGSAKKLRTVAERLAKRLDANVIFKPDPSRIRQGEPVHIQGSHDCLTEATGWRPTCLDEDDLIDGFLA